VIGRRSSASSTGSCGWWRAVLPARPEPAPPAARLLLAEDQREQGQQQVALVAGQRVEALDLVFECDGAAASAAFEHLFYYTRNRPACQAETDAFCHEFPNMIEF
jgi:hypothetical protein